MTTNAKINKALSEIVNGNIWAMSCPLEQPGDEYIVYNPELESAELFADDTMLEWVDYMQIHYFVRKSGESKKPENYIKKKNEIRAALCSADFCVEDITVLYEKDTGYTHVAFSVSCEQDE